MTYLYFSVLFFGRLPGIWAIYWFASFNIILSVSMTTGSVIGKMLHLKTISFSRSLYLLSLAKVFVR